MIFIETSVIDLLVVIVGADQNDCKFFINQGKRDFLDEFLRKKPSSSNSMPGGGIFPKNFAHYID